MRVVYPRNYLAFQVGETAQIFTGGVLRATPHAVQAGRWYDFVANWLSVPSVLFVLCF